MQSQNDNQDFFVFQKKTTDYIHVLFLCLIERLILNLNKNTCKKWRGDAAVKNMNSRSKSSIFLWSICKFQVGLPPTNPFKYCSREGLLDRVIWIFKKRKEWAISPNMYEL